MIRLFLSLIDKHSPNGQKLHKCFNRNMVKETYCTLSNMMDKIGNHNAKVLNKEKEPKVIIVNRKVKDQANCPTMPDRCDQTNAMWYIRLMYMKKVLSWDIMDLLRTNLRKYAVNTSHPSRKKKKMPHYAIHLEVKGQTNKVVN